MSVESVYQVSVYFRSVLKCYRIIDLIQNTLKVYN